MPICIESVPMNVFFAWAIVAIDFADASSVEVLDYMHVIEPNVNLFGVFPDCARSFFLLHGIEELYDTKYAMDAMLNPSHASRWLSDRSPDPR